jgi:hypothetical protein
VRIARSALKEFDMFVITKRRFDRLMKHAMKSLDTVIAIATEQTQKVEDLRLNVERLELEKAYLYAELHLTIARLDLADMKLYRRDQCPEISWLVRLHSLEDPRTGS